MRTLPVL